MQEKKKNLEDLKLVVGITLQSLTAVLLLIKVCLCASVTKYEEKTRKIKL